MDPVTRQVRRVLARPEKLAARLLIILCSGFVFLLTACQEGGSLNVTMEATETIAAATPSVPLTPYPPVRSTPPVKWRFRGAAVTGYWNTSYAQPGAFSLIDRLKASGVNSIGLLVTWYQADMTASEISPQYEGKTPNDQSLADLIAYIHAQGMQVMLKPHVEPQIGWDGTPGGWRGVINPADREVWFNNYGRFILYYARLAADSKVELYCIGSEMPSMTQSQADQERWAALAQQVRLVYPGEILYGAHRYEVFGGKYNENGPDGNTAFSADFQPLPAGFWTSFDYAGLSAYFDLYSPRLLAESDPGVDALVDGWYRNDRSERAPEQAFLFDALTRWQALIGKPVLFTEIGYRNVDYAADHTYASQPLLKDGVAVDVLPNDSAQASAYQAALEIWGDVPWLAGAFWWQFNPSNPVNAACGNQPAPADEISFSPCGRPAMNVLKLWYHTGN
jgi:hypothetical protein